MIKIKSQCKELETFAQPWKIAHTVELSESRFRYFQNHLLDDYPFIAEHTEDLHTDGQGVTHGLLVLCEGSDDGILVNSEGHNYARYTAFLPGARTQMLTEQYPALRDFCVGMGMLVAFSAERAVREQEDGQCFISYGDVEEEADLWIYHQKMPCFDRKLFAEMLSERPEFAAMDVTQNEIHLTLAPEFVQEQGQEQSM